jgi:D-sedoheptulose 7-phosphate isomerase
MAQPTLDAKMKSYQANLYIENVVGMLHSFDWDQVKKFAKKLFEVSSNGNRIFFIGNGGSAANAEHISNDFTYGINKMYGKGLNVHALSSNSSILTCLANDIGYDNIYSHQLSVYGQSGDLLVCFSGSGNSQNIVNALKAARDKGISSIGILGYDGGNAAVLSDTVIHINSFDMQVCEDMQLIIGHYVMKYLSENMGLLTND